MDVPEGPSFFYGRGEVKNMKDPEPQKPQKRAENGRILPGTVLNPGGRPKKDPEAYEILKANTKKAAAKLVALMDDRNTKVALQAAQSLLDRVWGKPVQASEVQMDVSGALDVRAQIHAALLEQAKQAKEHAE